LAELDDSGEKKAGKISSQAMDKISSPSYNEQENVRGQGLTLDIYKKESIKAQLLVVRFRMPKVKP